VLTKGEAERVRVFAKIKTRKALTDAPRVTREIALGGKRLCVDYKHVIKDVDSQDF
jgi:hypothetical protein